jgi:hypothetical protein
VNRTEPKSHPNPTIEPGAYRATLSVRSWQLCYDAGPDGLALALAGSLAFGEPNAPTLDVEEVHLCNGHDTDRYFATPTPFKDYAIGALQQHGYSVSGAITVREGDPMMLYQLLEHQRSLDMQIDIDIRDDSLTIPVRSLHFYL